MFQQIVSRLCSAGVDKRVFAMELADFQGNHPDLLLGTEREGWLRCHCGEALDAHSIFVPTQSFSEGDLTVDAGFDHVEICTSPGSILETNWRLRALDILAHRNIPQSARIVWQDERPLCATPARWGGGSPRRVLSEALARERGEENVLKFETFVVSRAATHFHLGIDPWSEVGVEVMNWFNNLAPLLCAVFAKVLGAPANRNSVYKDWARPERLPAPRWFEGPEEVQVYLGSFPRLLCSEGREVDLQDSGSWEDLYHLKGTWWLVRPSRHKTVELRFLPAMGVIPSRVALRIVACLLHAILSRQTHLLPRLSDELWWRLF